MRGRLRPPPTHSSAPGLVVPAPLDVNFWRTAGGRAFLNSQLFPSAVASSTVAHSPVSSSELAASGPPHQCTERAFWVLASGDASLTTLTLSDVMAGLAHARSTGVYGEEHTHKSGGIARLMTMSRDLIRCLFEDAHDMVALCQTLDFKRDGLIDRDELSQALKLLEAGDEDFMAQLRGRGSGGSDGDGSGGGHGAGGGSMAGFDNDDTDSDDEMIGLRRGSKDGSRCGSPHSSPQGSPSGSALPSPSSGGGSPASPLSEGGSRAFGFSASSPLLSTAPLKGVPTVGARSRDQHSAQHSSNVFMRSKGGSPIAHPLHMTCYNHGRKLAPLPWETDPGVLSPSPYHLKVAKNAPRLYNILGLPRPRPVTVALMQRSRVGFLPHTHHASIERPASRQLHTLSIRSPTRKSLPARCPILDVRPGRLDFGVLCAGRRYAMPVMMTNTGQQIARFRSVSPVDDLGATTPNERIRVYCVCPGGRGKISPGLSARVWVVVDASCVGDVETEVQLVAEENIVCVVDEGAFDPLLSNPAAVTWSHAADLFGLQ